MCTLAVLNCCVLMCACVCLVAVPSATEELEFGNCNIVDGGVDGSIYDAQVHVTNKFLLTTGTDRKVHVYVMFARQLWLSCSRCTIALFQT